MHSALYLGSLEHRRHAPRAHAFRYRLFMAYLDLDEIDVVFRGRWCWSTTRAALARFDRRHYLGDPGVPLDESVRALVTERTGRRPEGPIRLLTHLAYFGYVFNPVSFYYCFAADGRRLEAVVAEVTNTPWAGFAIHGYYDDSVNLHGLRLAGVPVRGSIDRLLTDLELEAIDQVWIALPLRAEERIRELLHGLRVYPVQVRFVPDIFNFSLLHHSVTEIAGLPVINLTDSPLQGPNRVIKGFEDFVLSAVILVAVGLVLVNRAPK